MKVLHCRVAGMRRCPILLPPHNRPVDVVAAKISLYHIITDDSQIFSGVQVSLNKVALEQSGTPLLDQRLVGIQRNDLVDGHRYELHIS